VEHRNLGGRVAPITRTRKTKADHTRYAIFPGDPVILVSGDAVSRIRLGADATTNDTGRVLGVVRAVLNSNGRPKTHSLPGGDLHVPASTAGFVQVNEDPSQTFLVSTDTTATSGMVGRFVRLTANAPNSAAGISGLLVANNLVHVTGTANAPFQVVGLGANNLDGWVDNETGQDIEVMIAFHHWNGREFNRTD
jgi:hypothetical protein